MCSTPWTMTRLVRWRVKDWASCFLACRLPLDDEPADRCCPATPQLPIRNMAFDAQDDSRGNETHKKKMSRHKKCNRAQARRLSHGPKQVKDTSPVEIRSSDDSSCRPHSADEEFIVFCFKEDGAFDVVKNGKLESPHRVDCTSRNSSSRPVNRKLNYGEDTKTVERCSNEERLTGKVYEIYPTNDGKCIIFDQKDEEEEEYYLGAEPPPAATIAEDRRMVSVESSDSNQSDGSAGSFAFPVLGMEWPGSPVQMPKSEAALDWRKHKPRCRGFQFQCFRF